MANIWKGIISEVITTISLIWWCFLLLFFTVLRFINFLLSKGSKGSKGPKGSKDQSQFERIFVEVTTLTTFKSIIEQQVFAVKRCVKDDFFNLYLTNFFLRIIDTEIFRMLRKIPTYIGTTLSYYAFFLVWVREFGAYILIKIHFSFFILALLGRIQIQFTFFDNSVGEPLVLFYFFICLLLLSLSYLHYIYESELFEMIFNSTILIKIYFGLAVIRRFLYTKSFITAVTWSPPFYHYILKMQQLALILQLVLAAQILIICIVLVLLNLQSIRGITLINFLGFSTIITLLGTMFFVYQFSLIESILLNKISLLESRITELSTLITELQHHIGIKDLLNKSKPTSTERLKTLIQSLLVSAAHATFMSTFKTTFLTSFTPFYDKLTSWEQFIAVGLFCAFGSVFITNFL